MQYSNNNNNNTNHKYPSSNKQTKVQISVYASKLKNVAGTFKGTSDPYAVVTILAGTDEEQPQVLGKTEIIKNSLNPEWTTSFQTTYAFGQETKFVVSIFDAVSTTKNVKPKPMGSATFEVGECLGARGNIKAKKLRHGGSVFARVTKAAESDYGTFHCCLRGIKMKNVDGFFQKSDPLFVVSAQIESAGGQTWLPVFRSKPVINDLNPLWEAFSISMEKLCQGDKTKPIRIQVFDWEKSGKNKPMGSFETNVQGLLAAKREDMAQKNAKEISPKLGFPVKRKGKDYGYLIVTSAYVTGENLTPAVTGLTMAHRKDEDPNGLPPFGQCLDEPQTRPSIPSYPASRGSSGSSLPPAIPPPQQMHSTVFPSTPQPQSSSYVPQSPPTTSPRFVDYLSGGCEISLGVAIDFTGSNGDPRIPGTLHYMHNDGQLNDYEKALTAVGSIIARYDSDQKFPVWGFGAKYDGIIRHCFQIGASEELSGVGGMIEGYRQTFRSGLVMSGPTVFAEVINYAAVQAQRRFEQSLQQGKQSYTVLLILTDGAVTDIETTKQAIRYASTFPLSIVVVGIGRADFSKMRFLDDFQRNEGGSTRDIVQFVEFEKHKHNKRALTRETLDEIPDQLVQFFNSKEIMPMPPVAGSKRDIYEQDYDDDVDIDLSFDTRSDGEIVLENVQQAKYNAQSYGHLSSFLPPPVAPPRMGSQAAMPYNNNSGSFYQQSSLSSIPTAKVVTPISMIHIQAPENSYAGMPLQVQNPSTGQFQIVTIPQGVPPGSVFAVNL